MSAVASFGPATQDAAKLILMFGEEVAAEVFRKLSPAEVQHLGAAVYAIEDVNEDEADRVLEDFLTKLAGETGLAYRAGGYVRSVLSDAFGPDRAQSVLARINPLSLERPIELLDWMDAATVLDVVSDEHPQIIALVIACLDATRGSIVLTSLDEELQSDILRRIATLGTVTPEALADLEKVLQRKFKASSSSSASQIGGVKAAARIMNFMRSDAEARILKDIRKDNKDLMTAIQDNMFVFDNLGKSDDRSLQTLLRAIDPEQLVLALKGADDVLRERLLSCMSLRAAAGIRDEMEALGPVRLSEVQEAQKRIVASAREMADAGTIVLAGRGGEEMV
ncbi:MAG: flagellar motor switch protein FliG [Roseibaca calidilacus]|uniref:Flagellar motor switch protein FliG n=1 Tax=Roseibaca calidilacus TaxID=1666912 RepID=A0A0P7WW83_9RHOB|nr:flagellar motor switch protein FliG [Roseibaca calidilacus]KPP95539.1 MAG: flagellar motor switch protein FliG [Roseibaca calidilacus]CUX82124.1 flagellar motor switch protein FliG [Roseibaca calidilacus]